MTAVHAEIQEHRGVNRIKVSWGGFYDPDIVAAIKKVPTACFVPHDKSEDGKPYWYIQLKLDIARELRTQFKDQLVLGPELKRWGKRTIKHEDTLVSLNMADNAELPKVKAENRPLYDALHIGPKGARMTPQQRRQALAGPASYQTADVRFMADCANPLNANQPGCIAADTIIECNRAGKSFKIPVWKLHGRLSGLDANYPGSHWSENIITRVRAAFDDGTIGLVNLHMSYDSGIKETFEVMVSSGRSIRATAEHPFLTPMGWRKLEELRPGMEILMSGPQGNPDKTKKMWELTNSVQRHPHARAVRGDGRRVLPRHRLVVEAHVNGYDFNDYLKIFRSNSRVDIESIEYLRPDQVVHHKDHNPRNNHIDNLEILEGQSEHAKEHNITSHGAYRTVVEAVVSVRRHGLEQTYDLSLATDPHNFIANGFVVHNTGKTIECIGAVWEAGLMGTAKLVVSQKSALNTVWKRELERWQHEPVIVATGSAAEKQLALRHAMALHKKRKPFWLVCNMEMVRYKGIYRVHPVTGKKEEIGVEWAFPEFAQVEWGCVIVDELHRVGLNNNTTLSARGAADLKTRKRIALSGTPMGGKPLKLWAALHWLEPKEFSSKWTFANTWLEVESGYGTSRKITEKIIHGKTEDFGRMISRYVVRRTKDEVMPWLPPKNEMNIWAEMDGDQADQYAEFAEMAEIRIDDEDLSAVGILAEYTRLKQFAVAKQRLSIVKKWDKLRQEHVEVITPYPLPDSCKLPHVMRILGEAGIAKDEEEAPAGALIFSQFSKVVDMVDEYLHSHGIRSGKLHGGTNKRGEREALQEAFQAGQLQVLVMNTLAGGTSIDLQRANTVIFLDTTWNPDDQEQASDRGHRGAKTDQVNVYTILTAGTIEQYIYEVNREKAVNNFNVLDARRKGLRAMQGALPTKEKRAAILHKRVLSDE